jgi:DNA polymerase/3'-5' exonuclease PolX
MILCLDDIFSYFNLRPIVGRSSESPSDHRYNATMEYVNEEGKKLRKKDATIYYRNKAKKLIKVPGIQDSPTDVKNYLKTCLKLEIEISDVEIDNIWDELIKRNKVIIDALDQLKRESETDGDVWKTRAYAKAVKILNSLKIPIISGLQVQKIDGIGKGIAAHVDEIINTGGLKSQDERTADAVSRQTTMEKFLSIWGVGPKHAKAWYAKGHREIEDLAAEKLTEQQKVGIKYHTAINTKIPREKAEKLFTSLKTILIKKLKNIKIEMVGSYRRGAEEMGDIDVMISNRENNLDLDEIVTMLEQKDIIVERPVLGVEKFMGIASLSGNLFCRIDIRLVPYEEWGTSLLHHTGSDAFNKQLRQHASQLGYKLSEKGLFKLSVKDDGDERMEINDEKDVFKILEFPYVEPKQRT